MANLIKIHEFRYLRRKKSIVMFQRYYISVLCFPALLNPYYNTFALIINLTISIIIKKRFI